MSKSSDSVKDINTRIRNPTGYKENKKERHERNMSWTRNMRRETIPQIADIGFDNANKHNSKSAIEI